MVAMYEILDPSITWDRRGLHGASWKTPLRESPRASSSVIVHQTRTKLNVALWACRRLLYQCRRRYQYGASSLGDCLRTEIQTFATRVHAGEQAQTKAPVNQGSRW